MNNIERIKTEKERIGLSWGKINPERIKAVMKFSGRKILDIGCSQGNYVKLLRENGYDAYGMDLLFHTEWEGKYLKCFSVGDIVDLPYRENYFDTVLAFEVLEHISDVDLTIQEMHRVARKNIIISVPNCKLEYIFKSSGLVYHHWLDRSHVQTFAEDRLRDILTRNDFLVKKIHFINPIRPEILFLDSLRIPYGTRTIANLLMKNPLRKYRYMTILVVAGKK